jgi:predicted regulator of Ras-like GTPase activity (Roadblock/LC7/MglB family)
VKLTRTFRALYRGPMFKDDLRAIVDGMDGGIASLLMDSSGIALESYSKDDAPFDINMIGIEFSVVVNSIKRATEMLEAGVAREVAVNTEKMTTVIRMLSEEYFLTFTLRPDGNLGKARYLMRTAAPKLLAEL